MELWEFTPGFFIGESMKPLAERVVQVAPRETTVLIVGETGTGKDLLARAVHKLSPHNGKSYVVIDCAGLAESVAESELFGHEQGAFTGANRKKTGLFAMADSGTVFIDEVSELSLTLQPKLLRALENREIRPVGSTSVEKIHARVIAATSQDLAVLASAGRFRHDLRYRLEVVILSLPPLRERRQEIRELACRFLDIFRPEKYFTAQALDAMKEYSWPGNVRELKNFVERVSILVPGKELGVQPISAHLEASRAALETKTPEHSTILDASLTFREMQRKYLSAVLKDCGGNIRKATAVSGISQRTIYKWIKQFNMREDLQVLRHRAGR